MILPPESYHHVFSKWSGSRACLFADSGNIGDRLIRDGERVLFAFYNIQLVPAELGPDVIFWGGGGNMGSCYEWPLLERGKARKAAEHFEIPLVVLPQSWMGHCNCPAMQNFVREQYSLRYRSGGILAPDLGLASNLTTDIKPQFDQGYFFRIDQEQGAEKPKYNDGDPSIMLATEQPQAYLDLAGKYEVIHTNRLHFAVAAMLARREVVLYPNSYHKNRGVYEMWLHGRGVEWRDSFPTK